MNPNDYDYMNSSPSYQQSHTDNRRGLVKLLIILLVIAAAIFILLAILARPFVNIEFPDGADSIRLTKQNSDGTVTSTTLSTGGKTRLQTGSYVVASYKAKQVVGISTAEVHKAFSQSVAGTNSSATGALRTVMHQHADMTAPLGNGYLYVDKSTRAVFYSDTTATLNLSSRLLLSQTDPQDPNFTGTYSTVIGIHRAADGSVILVTTTDVFIVKSPTNITRLPSSSKELLNMTSSSYDAATNKLYFLATYNNGIYFYDLGKPGNAPEELIKVPLAVNRITSGGGKVAVLFDDVPSLEPSVIDAYAATRQLSPLIIDETTGKIAKQLPDWKGASQFALSGDGRYILLKKKFAVLATVFDLQTNDTMTIAAPDTNAYAWQGTTLYFARDNSLWAVTPDKSGGDVKLVAASGTSIIRVQIAGDKILATTNDSYISEVAAAPYPSSSSIEELRKVQLQTDAYYIAFTTSGTQTHFVIETTGTSDGLDDASIAAAKSTGLAGATQVIQNYLTQPGNTVSSLDTSITTPYENAVPPPDSN
jgi:hypothetical protein